MLASLLYPYDDDVPSLISGWLDELEREHCVQRYEVNGDSYIEVCNWLNHQKIDRPSKSKIPPFDESSRTLASPREDSLRIKDQGSYKGAHKSRAPSFDASTIELPSWLNSETWAKWVADRKARRKPITEAGAKAQIEQLAKFRAAGHSPEDVIAYSLAGGYQGLFAPNKSKQSDSPLYRREGVM
jgi:hypothetical protein